MALPPKGVSPSPVLQISRVADSTVRTNFENIQRHHDENPHLVGFKFIGFTTKGAVNNLKIAHGLKAAPTDLVRLHVTGDGICRFNRDKFDDRYIDVSTTGPMRVRLFAGNTRLGSDLQTPELPNASNFEEWYPDAPSSNTDLLDALTGEVRKAIQPNLDSISDSVEDISDSVEDLDDDVSDLKKLLNETVFIQDQKPNNTDGGVFTAGAWRTRTLNTLINPLSYTWVSLDSNQITLQPGTYKFKARVPAYRVESHKARLFNVTDNAVQLWGSAEIAENVASATQNHSYIEGYIAISETKAFQVEHRCATTRDPNGFGDGNGGSLGGGTVEVFTQIEITRVR